MSRIVLHIGAPKTGSTYIQRMLQSAPEVIRAQGVYYPILPDVAQMAGNAKLLASSMLGHVTPSFRRAFPQINPMALDPTEIARDLLRGWKPDSETLVLSAETFMPDHAEQLRAMLPKGADIKIVLFVRRQDLWFESYFNQLTKTGNIQTNMDQFTDDVMRNETGRYCTPNWYSHWRHWVGAFGACEVVFFDSVKQDLFRAFLSASDLPTLDGVPEIDAQQVSMSNHHTAYLLDIMGDLPADTYEVARKACLQVPSADAPKLSLLSPNQREVIRNAFEPSNQKLLGAIKVSSDDVHMNMQDGDVDHITLDAIWGSDSYRRFKAICDAAILDGKPH